MYVTSSFVSYVLGRVTASSMLKFRIHGYILFSSRASPCIVGLATEINSHKLLCFRHKHNETTTANQFTI